MARTPNSVTTKTFEITLPTKQFEILEAFSNEGLFAATNVPMFVRNLLGVFAAQSGEIHAGTEVQRILQEVRQKAQLAQESQEPQG